MGIFSKKKEEKKVTVRKARSSAAPVKLRTATARGTNSHILRAPRITEKASVSKERGVYVFMVDPRATKRAVRDAVLEIYGVTPRKVNIAQIPPKLIFSGRRKTPGVKPGGKKAYVYLRPGEKIEVV